MSSSADSRAVSYLVGVHDDELVYDFLISLDTEIRLVWKAPWKFGKLLYFLTRYLAFAGAISTVFLKTSRFTSLGTCKALNEGTSLILSLRVWAVWGNSRKIACLLVIGFLAPMPIMCLSSLPSTPQYQKKYLPASVVCVQVLPPKESALRISTVTWHIFHDYPLDPSLLELWVLPALLSLLLASVTHGPMDIGVGFDIVLGTWELFRGTNEKLLVDYYNYSYESIIYNKLGFCPPFLVSSNPVLFMFVYLTAYETVILVLTVYKARKHGIPVFAPLSRSIWKSHFFHIQILRVRLQAAMHSILTSRMLLHIRQEAMDAALPTTQYSQSLRFASGPLNEDEFENDDGQRIQSQVSRQLVTVDEGQSWFGGSAF
ncbi:hypothetical protein K435DRAFT_796042 [Dendrothele bispora CBS 962.96]|uniref:DUF6533 domain-containing protein n=1 Tax=Dendrothele bispora (strain CBS 962.96) TaxID=1314807 RepID=A0A4S8M6V2_DENBC|nr:hypothetical protein K435DRAFT_796042 [Dendrothele bispora CBS 962.96]